MLKTRKRILHASSLRFSCLTILGLFSDNQISPDFPPIAGYTGHIPRLKGTDASLSQRYNMAARQGLTLLQQERARRKGAVLHEGLNGDRYTTPAM